MDFECQKCKHDNDDRNWKFDNQISCEKCNAEHDVDWDYDGGGNIMSWVTGLTDVK